MSCTICDGWNPQYAGVGGPSGSKKYSDAGRRFCVAQVSEGLNACSFAAALSQDEAGVDAPLAAFRGQMAAIYLFDTPLTLGKFQYRAAFRLRGHVG